MRRRLLGVVGAAVALLVTGCHIPINPADPMDHPANAYPRVFIDNHTTSTWGIPASQGIADWGMPVTYTPCTISTQPTPQTICVELYEVASLPNNPAAYTTTYRKYVGSDIVVYGVKIEFSNAVRNSTSAALKRTIAAHEWGHGTCCQHVAQDSGAIMEPVVDGNPPGPDPEETSFNKSQYGH